jgi:choline dehydrogenase-like flavoprotein
MPTNTPWTSSTSTSPASPTFSRTIGRPTSTVRGPKVVYHATQKTVERQAVLAEKATEVLKAAGAHAVHKTNIGVLLTHIMGTMRMGLDPGASVVNGDGEAHEVERLYVADSSILPSVGGANPTLTTQALAARCADRIASRHFS